MQQLQILKIANICYVIRENKIPTKNLNLQ